MALTVVVPNVSAADLTGQYSSAAIKYAKLTGDTSYPQGAGYAVTPGTFGFTTAIVQIVAVNQATSQYLPWYDPQNKSVRFIIPGNTTLSEVATSTNLSAVSLDCAVIGY
jgi:hypothetical protein